MTIISAKSILASRHSLDPKVRIDTLLLRPEAGAGLATTGDLTQHIGRLLR